MNSNYSRGTPGFLWSLDSHGYQPSAIYCEDYWSRDPHYRYAPIADKISRQRFRDISRYLHFVDNDHLAP